MRVNSAGSLPLVVAHLSDSHRCGQNEQNGDDSRVHDDSPLTRITSSTTTVWRKWTGAPLFAAQRDDRRDPHGPPCRRATRGDGEGQQDGPHRDKRERDRKSTRLTSSHLV